MRLKLLAGAALAAVFTASGASAQTINGWYGALDLGWHRTDGLDATAANAAPGGSYGWTFSTEDNWTGFARLGYRLNPNWRIELEGGYRPGDIDTVLGSNAVFPGAPVGLCRQGVIRTASSSVCQAPEGGTLESWTLMANILYDFMPADWRFRPFVGLGVGINRADLSVVGQFSNVGTITAANPRIQDVTINDEDLTFAYQGILGVAYAMSERLALDLTYRYLAGAELDFDAQGSAPGGLQPGRFSGEYQDQSITLGLRYAFAPPPPPPEPMRPEPEPQPEPVQPVVPEPQPQPEPVIERPVAREFIVYFPFDQSILTPEAQTVVSEAANYARTGTGATQVQVVGHADTSGSAAYNVRLSERRARAVADSLVAQGVSPSVITADWRGETSPAVQTGDGVREPLNRRATVNVNF